jgi:hypothetical protein
LLCPRAEIASKSAKLSAPSTLIGIRLSQFIPLV